MEIIKSLDQDATLAILRENFDISLLDIFSEYGSISVQAIVNAREAGKISDEWNVLAEWPRIEDADESFTEYDFFKMIFGDDDISNCHFLVSTLEGLYRKKYFYLPSELLLEFMEKYSDYVQEDMHFVQPMPYLFIAIERKTLYVVHDEGYLMKISVR